jgi:hypothetical protein
VGFHLLRRFRWNRELVDAGVLDTRNGQTVAFLKFQSGVPVVAESFLLPEEAMGDVRGSRR